MSLIGLSTSFANAYVNEPAGAPPGVRRMGAANAAAASTSTVGDNLRTLTDYIPSELLTVYIAGIAAIGSWSFVVPAGLQGAAREAAISVVRQQYFGWLFWGCLIAAPIVILSGIFLASDARPTWKAFAWPMLAAPIAFYVYALGIPNSWLAANQPNGGLIATLLVLIIAPLLHGITLIYVKVFQPKPHQ